jgi:hypothetical protein
MDCVERLEWFYDFRESCINAEAMLEGYFSSLKFNEEFRKTGKVSTSIFNLSWSYANF